MEERREFIQGILAIGVLVSVIAAVFLHDYEALKVLLPIASIIIGFYFGENKTERMFERVKALIREIRG